VRHREDFRQFTDRRAKTLFTESFQRRLLSHNTPSGSSQRQEEKDSYGTDFLEQPTGSYDCFSVTYGKTFLHGLVREVYD
jgi:hypothetical protein